jgi:DNA-binding NarL/FixJ family response regulator
MNETAIESAEKTRILIIDDHAMFRDALRKLIESQPGLTVAGEASNARDAIEQLKILKPHIMLLDLSMPREPGMEVLRRVTDAPLETRTILLVAAIERDQITEALRLGAHGVLLKDTASQLLYRCIRVVMGGEYWIDKECVAYLVRRIRAVSEPAQRQRTSPSSGSPRESRRSYRRSPTGIQTKRSPQSSRSASRRSSII